MPYLGLVLRCPIVQSILRYVQAEGFGKEIAQEYENLTTGTQELLETSTSQFISLAESCTSDTIWFYGCYQRIAKTKY